MGAEALEDEARRRAFEGVTKLVTVAGQREEIRQYSDTLLIFLLKAHFPEKYRERQEVRHSGDMEFRYAGLTPEQGREELIKRAMAALDGP